MKSIYNNILFTVRLLFVRVFSEPILIWNMGKVGSTSIARSLWPHAGRINVIATHFINKKENTRSLLLYQILFKPPNKKVVIISATRDPVIRNISSFFQNFEANYGCSFSDFHGDENDVIHRFLHEWDKHEVTSKWFDINIKKFTGLNVYDCKFNEELKSEKLSNSKFEILVIRAEDNNDVKEAAISDFLGLRNFKIIDENVSSDKPYSSLYRKVLATINLPAEYLDMMYESEYARHFYNEDERNVMRARWLRR